MSNSYKYIDPDFTYTDPKTELLRNLQDITDSDVLLFVEISKDGKQFFPTSHFDNALRYIDQIIAEFTKIPRDNKKLFAEKLAEILDNVNYLHPFREGNGRTQREFLRLLALEKGLILNINPPDNKSVYERYMKGTIESDVKTLTGLIFELIDTNDKQKNGL
jgi:cell filamentation protein